MKLPTHSHNLQDRREAIEVSLLLEALHLTCGTDYRGYKKSHVIPIIKELKLDFKATHISDLISKLLYDQQCSDTIRQTLLLHYTQFFRDAPAWRSLSKLVFPQLKTYPYPTIWVAGCSSGEEIISLLILLCEEKLLDQANLYASDASTEIVNQAKTGRYESCFIKESKERYFEAGGQETLTRYFNHLGHTMRFDESLLNQCCFSVHNLATDAKFITTHLTICRNVLIYFEPTLQDRALSLIADSIIPGGFLWLGPSENIQFRQAGAQFRVIDKDHNIYQKQ